MTDEQLDDLKQFFMANRINPGDAVVGMTSMIGILLQTFSLTTDSRAKAIDLVKSIETMLRVQ